MKMHEDAHDKLRAELSDANRKLREMDQTLTVERKELTESKASLGEEKMERASLAKQYEELRELYGASEREKLELQSQVQAKDDLIFKCETVKETLEHDLIEVFALV